MNLNRRIPPASLSPARSNADPASRPGSPHTGESACLAGPPPIQQTEIQAAHPLYRQRHSNAEALRNAVWNEQRGARAAKTKHRSDDGHILLGTAGSAFMQARPSVPVASAVLKVQQILDGGPVYVMNVDYVQDCGEYARDLMARIAGINFKEERASYRALNAEGHPTSSFCDETFYDATVFAPAAPDVGQAFLMINDPNDPRTGKSHFNFHWATVIARSGNDVVTAEADSKEPDMRFHMYSLSDPAHSFKQHYLDAGKASEHAKVFTIRFVKTGKTSAKDGAQTAEVVEID